MAKLIKKRGRVSGSVAVNKNPVVQYGNQLGVTDTDGTIVKAGAAVTISQDYNSFKVEVGIELPTTIFNIKDTFKEAWDLVDTELAKQQQAAQKVLDGL